MTLIWMEFLCSNSIAILQNKLFGSGKYYFDLLHRNTKFLSAVVPFDNMVRGVHRNNVNKATDRNISRTQSLSRDVVSVPVTLSYFTFVNNESYLSIASASQTLY